nr:hypothetical protein [Tanacetum cinerariifolium]
MNTTSTLGSGPLLSNTIGSPKGELKAITTRGGLVLNGPSIPLPPLFINPEEDERVKETLTDPDLDEFTIKVPPPLGSSSPQYPLSSMHKQKQQEKDEVQIHKFWQMFKQLHINITLVDALILIPKYQKFLKALLFNKEKLLELANTSLNENCSAVILKKFPEKLRDPGKFLIPCGFSEFKCKALANLGASINLMPLCEMDSILEDSIDESNHANPNVNLVDTMLEMFIDEHALDYSSPLLYDEYNDDLFEVESETEYVYNDPFDSKGEKIKESKLLIDELDLPRSNLPIKENLVPIPSESEVIPDNMCDVAFRDNSLPLDISKDQYEDFFYSNDDSTSIDDDSFSIGDIDYVEASPPHSELISLEDVKDFHPKDGEIEDDALRENLSKINILIAKIEALNASPTSSSDFVLKSPSSFPNSFLEETDTSDNSLPESEIFCFDIEEKNSGRTTIHADISHPDLECFYFKSEPNPRDLTSIIDLEIHEIIPSATNVNLSPEDGQSPLFDYVVWIFLPFFTYPIAHPYLLSSRNEDTIFDPGISIYHFLMSGVFYRSGTFMKFNVYSNHLNESPIEILSSTCFPMDQ